MGDYDYCSRHDVSFLMPELLMCPRCAREALERGDVPEPVGDALLEYCRTLEVLVELEAEQRNARIAFLTSALTDLHEAASEEWPDRACVVFAKRVLDTESHTIPSTPTPTH